MQELLSPVTTNQFINYVIVDETIKNNNKFDSQVVLEILATAYNIKSNSRGSLLSSRYIQNRQQELKSGRKPLSLPSILNGKPSTRHYKDMMYAELNRLVECFLPKKDCYYCGLPAQHLYHISDHFNAPFIVGCETSDNVFEWVNKLHTVFFEKENTLCWTHSDNTKSVGDEKRGMIKTDIFSHLASACSKGYKNLYSVLDLDLMVNIKSIDNWDIITKVMYQIMKPISVVNLTTSVGRNISDIEYEALMPHMLERTLLSNGFKSVKTFSGRYLDRKIPMRYEHLVLTK